MTRSVPYEPIPAGGDRSGNAILDDGSFQPVPATQGATTRGAGFEPHGWASNFLMVSGKRSATGHPLFVAGPQIGYYYPGLTFELDLHGPGYEARGASSPAQPGSILIGRGPDFAWSLTSAGSDTTDDFVETLCDGSDLKYMYKGQCRDMETIDAGEIVGQGKVVFHQTVHGPVIGYATVGGTRVAISQQRSSYMRDAQWNLLFKDATEGRIHSVGSFLKSAAQSPFTFNVAYADDKQHRDLLGRAAAAAQPARGPAPADEGHGRVRVDGLPGSERPRVPGRPAERAAGQLEQQARARTGARPTTTGPTARRIARRCWSTSLAKRKKHTLATRHVRDERGRHPGPALGRADAAARQAARGQHAAERRARARCSPRSTRGAPSGSSRLDVNLDGKADAGAGPAIWDALYPRLADAILAPAIGPQNDFLSTLVGRVNGPASGFQDGRIWIIDKDLKPMVGESVQAPYRTKFCGSGRQGDLPGDRLAGVPGGR